MDDTLYSELKSLARRENRSVTQEVIRILELYLASPGLFQQNSTREFLALSGSLEDSRSADQIISEIRKDRRGNGKFRQK